MTNGDQVWPPSSITRCTCFSAKFEGNIAAEWVGYGEGWDPWI